MRQFSCRDIILCACVELNLNDSDLSSVHIILQKREEKLLILNNYVGNRIVMTITMTVAHVTGKP